MKVLRTVPNDKFEVIQLGDNLTWSVRIRYDLPIRVKKGLVECLRANVDFFDVSLHEMLGIDPSVSCH